jgi:hypothetical protein
VEQELKKKIIDLLIKDEEFRYAILGILEISDVTKRLDFLIENNKKIWEEIRSLNESQNKLWESQIKLWESQNKLWEEVKALREGQNKLWEVVLEHSHKIDILSTEIYKLKLILEEMRGERGIPFERLILSLYSDALKKFGIFYEKVEKKKFIDKRGIIREVGREVDVDIYIHNDKRFLIEVKAYSDDEDDVWKTLKRAQLLKEDYNLDVQPVIVAISIEKSVLNLAKEKNVIVIYGDVTNFKEKYKED